MEPELQELGDRVEKYISTHQKLRDEWNSKVGEHRSKRDSINGQKRELYDEIERQRTVRDQENGNAREAKVVRRELNENFFALKDKLHELQSDAGGNRKKKEDDPEQLRRAIRNLESNYEQGRFTGRKAEKEFEAKMKGLSRKLRELTTVNDALPTEHKEAHAELDALHEKREAAHAEVIRAADAAQAAHDLMAKLRDETRRLNAAHEDAHRSFIDARNNADEEHQKYIVAMRCVYSVRNLIQAKNDRAAGHEPTRVEARPEAQDLMSALMSGQTLSTEQLMAMNRKERTR